MFFLFAALLDFDVRLGQRELGSVGGFTVEPRRHDVELAPIERLDELGFRAAAPEHPGVDRFSPALDELRLEPAYGAVLPMHPRRVFRHADAQLAAADALEGSGAI